jgi:hypothetical protein
MLVLQKDQNILDSNHVYMFPSYLAVLWDTDVYDHWLYRQVRYFHVYKICFLCCFDDVSIVNNCWNSISCPKHSKTLTVRLPEML